MIDVDSYGRDLEAYLCRKNDGHLIRIVGPAFEQVMGWARQGIPLKVTESGVDRYFERYYRKGPRRRPVRIEFCEADVLDAFDDWRRAVGIARVIPDGADGPDVEEPVQGPGRSKRSLTSHLDMVVARLTVLRGSDKAGPALGHALDAAVRALDEMQPQAPRARGEAREALLQRLVEIDEALMAAATDALAPHELARLDAEATGEIAPFRGRMTAEAFERARRAARNRTVRHYFALPEIEKGV